MEDKYYMRKVLFILGILLVSVVSLYARIDKATTLRNNDKCVEEFLHDIVSTKKSYIGEPVSKLYAKIAHSCFHIRHMSTMSEGPWSQPDGKEYMKGVILYNKTLKEMDDKQEVYVVRITLNIWIDDRKFWNNLPNDTTWMQAIQERTKDMIVKDISFKKTRIY
ncbi:hypothetical protein AS203_11695 [Hoylesella enoeca]|uniref:Uncharacterized protein n=1 Tax=Hoylesella enoeca TaxID=76123 RepID=A0A0S2KNS2_9BACT|nr:hypothetical protein AS203_11695 [Hoylesella enoeca]